MKRKELTKILHVGNIANNAYQNAKILNKIDYDCDVLSYDYYHIMGCPEWDDSEFTGDLGSPNFPRWNKVDLHGYKRPKWFTSGPYFLCYKYLAAKNKNKKIMSSLYWIIMEWVRNDIACSEDTQKYTLLKLITIKNTIIRQILSIIPYAYSILRGVYFRVTKKCITDSIPKEKKQVQSSNIKTLTEVEDDFRRLFPERDCYFGKTTEAFINFAKSIRELLLQYDINVMYATNPILAYLAGIKNYIAYEHGTIRDLPYEDSDVGRLMLLSYANASAIYVTNVDCYDSAKYITKNTNTPIVCGLHGIDINQVIKKIDRASNIKEFDARFGISRDEIIFFCPSRHDYDEKQGTFLKCEDKMLRAAASLLKENDKFKIVMIEWGRDIDRIKVMINELGELNKHIMWIKPIQKQELYKVYANVEAVVDQFFWKSYGAITFEVLASKYCVLISSSANEAYQKEFFGDLVPYFACYEENEILESMKEVIERSPRYQEYKKTSCEWVKQHHSNEKIVVALEKSFQYCKEK